MHMWTIAQWSKSEEPHWANQMVHCSSNREGGGGREKKLYIYKLRPIQEKFMCASFKGVESSDRCRSPTTASGRLFHMRTVEWTKLLSNELVLASGTVSAWSGIDVLDRVTRFLFSGGGSSLYRSIGQCLVYILSWDDFRLLHQSFDNRYCAS